jgi:hypothetical protein
MVCDADLDAELDLAHASPMASPGGHLPLVKEQLTVRVGLKSVFQFGGSCSSILHRSYFRFGDASA